MSLTRRRFTLSLAVLALPAVAIARSLGQREEIRLGQAGAEAVQAHFKVGDDAAVDRVGRALAAVGTQPTLPWSFRVIDVPEVNALSLPGGVVYLTAGLLRHLGTDEGLLAAVLGQEIGHVEKRHGVHQIERGEWGGVPSALLRQAANGDIAGATQLAASLDQLRYRREQEYEADDVAIRLMRRTGRNPEALVRLLQLLRRVGGDGTASGWLRTHPTTEDRVERARDHIAEDR